MTYCFACYIKHITLILIALYFDTRLYFLSINHILHVGWERSYETMQEAKCPHLLYKEEWNKKQLQVKVFLTQQVLT